MAVLIPAAFALIALGLLLYGWVADLPPLAGVARRRRAARRDGARRPHLPRERRAAAPQPRRGADRRAQRARQPAPADARPRGHARDGERGVRADARASSTSTDSSPTTTPSATTPATRCCARAGPRARRLGRRAAAGPTASAATSSASCSTARRTRGDPIVARAADALSEHGEGFTVDRVLRRRPDPLRGRQLRGRAAAGRRAHVRPQGLTPRHQPAPGARRARPGARRARARAAPRTWPTSPSWRSRTGRELGIEPEQLDVISRAAELHDIGKVAVPDDIIHKPGPLDDVEWRIMRQHTLVGERILRRRARPQGGRAARAPEPRALGRRRATRTGSPARTSPSARASSPSATPTTR